MKKNKKNIFCIFIILIACIIFNFIKIHTSINTAITDEFSKYPPNAYGIILTNFDGSLCSNLELKSEDNELNYNFKFVNNTSENSDFILSTFIDFKQVNFSSTSNISINQYSFSLNKQQETVFPIKINTSNYSTGKHILTFIAYNNVNKFINTPNESRMFNQTICTYDLIINNTSEFVKPEKTITDFIQDDNPNKFKLTFNKNSYDNYDSTNKSQTINVKAGEMVSMNLTIGNYPNKDDYLFFLILDYDQVLMDDKFQYQYLTLSPGNSIKKQFTFKAPNKKGNYQLNGFLILNPWDRNKSQTLDSPRFNIIVN